MPKSNRPFWAAKFKRNKERDKRKEAALTEQGWDVLTVWECATFDMVKLIPTLTAFLEKNQSLD